MVPMMPDDEGDGEADEQRDAPAPEDERVQVAADRVGAEPVGLVVGAEQMHVW